MPTRASQGFRRRSHRVRAGGRIGVKILRAASRGDRIAYALAVAAERFATEGVDRPGAFGAADLLASLHGPGHFHACHAGGAKDDEWLELGSRGLVGGR